VGLFVLSQSDVSEVSESLTEEYEAFRTRDLSGEAVAHCGKGRGVTQLSDLTRENGSAIAIT
jgi:hypothetical protein